MLPKMLVNRKCFVVVNIETNSEETFGKIEEARKHLLILAEEGVSTYFYEEKTIYSF